VPDEQLLDVGAIRRAHGLRGQVSVELTTDRLERLASGAVLQTDRGSLTVVDAAAHSGRFLVTFAEITDRETAESWRGTVLRAPRLDADVLWVGDLFGATVETADGTVRGVVVAVEQHPRADVMVLDTGALVPVTFVCDVTPGARVVVDVPEGLFE
jgi:16S rRNA processing protein RimM